MPAPTEIPSHVSITVLELLSGQNQRTLQRYAVAGDMPKSIPGKGYPLVECLAAIRAIIAPKTRALEMEDDKAAKLRAERISAELDAESKRGSLLAKEDVEATWRDFITKLRVCIDNFQGVDDETKRRLAKEIQSLNIENLPDDAS